MAQLKRRALLKYGLVGVPVAAVATAGGLGTVFLRSRIDTTGTIDFRTELAIPPLAESEVDAEGRRVFELTAEAGQARVHPGRPTTTWGFNGDQLGPTLRARRGETVLVNVRNKLAETTSVHWHGMRLPATMDGGPHQPIEPDHTWSPTWKIDQPAATLWYHPHPHQETARHVYRGLAGLFVLDDPDADPGGLPGDYGVDDIPVIVQDRNFDDDNQLDETSPMFSDVGLIGETILVNGTLAPFRTVTTERLRLRLLNASNARVYNFGLDDHRTFDLIATDGGFLPAPHTTTRIQLSPGERAEIVVRLRAGERVVLRSDPPDMGLNPWDGRFGGADDSFDILQLRAAKELKPSGPLPGKLAEPPGLAGAEPAEIRDFRLSGRTINGAKMDMGRVDFASTAETVEIWEVVNADGTHHNFHVHDVRFQVLSVAGEAPPPALAGWKDTIYLTPHRRFRIAMRFGGHTDPDMPYMYHCHILYHEDQGMMGQFVVVEPGQEPGTPKGGHAGH